MSPTEADLGLLVQERHELVLFYERCIASQDAEIKRLHRELDALHHSTWIGVRDYLVLVTGTLSFGLAAWLVFKHFGM